jgi:hypothetical protein
VKYRLKTDDPGFLHLRQLVGTCRREKFYLKEEISLVFNEVGLGLRLKPLGGSTAMESPLVLPRSQCIELHVREKKTPSGRLARDRTMCLVRTPQWLAIVNFEVRELDLRIVETPVSPPVKFIWDRHRDAK